MRDASIDQAQVNGIPRFGDLAGAVGGDALVFDEVSGLWVPGAVASGGAAADLGTKVRLAANQTLTTGVTATVAFSAEDWDDEGLWAAGTPTKLVIPAGWTNVRVELTAAVVFGANATGRRVARIEKNGSIIARQDQQALTVSGAVTSFNLVAETTVSTGDEITLVVFQDSGGNLDLVASTANPVNLTLTRSRSGGGALLAIASATASAVYSTSSATSVAMDATNLSVTFTAPASGQVYVTLSGYATTSSTASGAYEWSLMTTGGAEVQVCSVVARQTTLARRSANFHVTGLTPGTTYTYRWGHRALAGVTGTTYTGGNAGTSGNAIMTVEAA